VSEAESESPPHLALASFTPIIIMLLGWLTTVVVTMTKKGTVAVAVFTQFDLGAPQWSSEVHSQLRLLYVLRRSTRSISARMAGAVCAIAQREADLKNS
jgi:hypothetical protein